MDRFAKNNKFRDLVYRHFSVVSGQHFYVDSFL